MLGEVHSLSDEERNRLLDYRQFPEGHFGDVKDKDIKPRKMSESISAFANEQGGELWIGISQDETGRIRSWRGFDTMEDANSHIQILTDKLEVGTAYSYDFVTHPQETGFVLHIEIGKSRSIIKDTQGQVWQRNGAQNLQVRNEAGMERLRRNKGITTFEDETISTDIACITNSDKIQEFIRNVVPNTSADAWLRKQQLIVNNLPTVAGILLFAEEPQAYLPKRSGIKIYRYQTTNMEGSRDEMVGEPLSLQGCAYDLIYAAVARVQQIIESLPVLGEHTIEPVRYPKDALHEIITNAVLHRDYGITDDIHIRIFDDRVEVMSPGTLPGHITIKNILREVFHRNPRLVRNIHRFPNPPNKDIGEGLNTAFQAMRDMQLKDPDIIQDENSVTFYIRHEKLATREIAVLDYLDTNPEITNTKGRAITGIKSENSMKRIFVTLRQRGLIEPVPGKNGRAFAWRKVQANQAVEPVASPKLTTELEYGKTIPML